MGGHGVGDSGSGDGPGWGGAFASSTFVMKDDCDTCGCEGPSWVFFHAEAATYFCLCDACADMVESYDWDKLLDRAVNVITRRGKAGGYKPAELREAMSEILNGIVPFLVSRTCPTHALAAYGILALCGVESEKLKPRQFRQYGFALN